jgi:glyoxylase-like metal-dependent hydrolase (beta-lactamase superfamily II)
MEIEIKTSSFPHGITCIDTQLHRPNMVACYLIEHEGMAGFIDTGVGNNVPMLMSLLKKKGIAPESVAYVMPTHVHLDHAGGAGRLMQELPNAKLLIHPRGARHMIDPSRLQAGSLAVYGEKRYKKIFGELIPIPANRVVEINDAHELDFNGRKLTFFDTPGHARHHFCIYDAQSKGLFTGDTFGASYGELNRGRVPFIFPPTTPVQFDPVAWKRTLDRLIALQPERIFVTHFGMHENVETLTKSLQQSLDDYVAIAEDLKDTDNPAERIREAIMNLSINTLLDSDCGLARDQIKSTLEMDMELNAQGLMHWLATR